jgi:hypothetical protein
MNQNASSAAQPGVDWRVKSGAALFVLSIVLPVAGIPLLASLGLSAQITATVSGALLIGAELLGIAAIAVMGKPGYLYIRSCVFGFLKRHGPPREVSRARYNTGLVMFMLPVLFGWATPYVFGLLPDLQSHLLACAIAGDALLLASLLVLGGDFWDKVRGLFIHSTKVCAASVRQAQ